MARSLRDSFSGFGSELLERIREDHYARLDDAAFEERVIGINKTILALREAEVEDEKIISVPDPDFYPDYFLTFC
jgi:hypothetical protein